MGTVSCRMVYGSRRWFLMEALQAGKPAERSDYVNFHNSAHA